MRKLFLFISLCGIFGSELFSPSALLASESTVSSETNVRNERTIELHGLFATGKMRSAICPFEVTKTSSLIIVYYLVDLSGISVEITDGLGQTVYSDIVNPIAQTELLIDIENWEEGEYTLSFWDSFGNCIFGIFEVSN